MPRPQPRPARGAARCSSHPPAFQDTQWHTQTEGSVLPCSSPGSLGTSLSMPAPSHSSPHALHLTISYHRQHASDFAGSLDATGSIAWICQSGALSPGPSSAPDWLCHCGQVPAPLWASVAPSVQWMGWEWDQQGPPLPSQTALEGNLVATLCFRTGVLSPFLRCPQAPVGGGLWGTEHLAWELLNLTPS